MALKKISLIIIFLNLAFLFKEIPTSVSLFSAGILLLSFLFNHPRLRTFIKLILLVSTYFVLRKEFGHSLSPEAAVSFVIVLSALKFWELNEPNDHFNMFLILILSECSLFLLVPNFSIFFFGLLKMILFFYYMLKIRNHQLGMLNFKRLFLLITPSLVFALLLFYTFPRFTSGFMNTNDVQYLRGGGASRLDIKDFGPLSNSSDYAFRVTGLAESKLAIPLLYWKTNVFWYYSKGEWETANTNIKKTDLPVDTKFIHYYQVELLGEINEYLPVLDGENYLSESSRPFNQYLDGSFKLKAFYRGNISYSVSGSYGKRSQEMNFLLMKKGLQHKSNKTDALMSRFKIDEVLKLDEEERLRDLISKFKNNNFQYNSSPQKYATLEDFILFGKEGYCSHFSAAFALLARLYKLPARVVGGYLGGQLNPFDNSIIVKEMDAHAWVEVYIQKKGWVKIDPTAFVAPERLQMSAEEFNQKLKPYYDLLGIKVSRSLTNIEWLSSINLWLDSINSKLSSSIVNFDKDTQINFLRSITPKKLPVGFFFALTLILFMVILWAIFKMRMFRRLNKEERRYRRFLSRLRTHQLHKYPSETASQFCRRAVEFKPELEDYVKTELEYYLKSFYK
jgi:transglutaminase-like putative cysteine protease